MPISADTAATVAAQLTHAWALRMGNAAADDAGKVGPALVQVYENFLEAVSNKPSSPEEIDEWIASHRGG